ncbi:MAG: amino acid adenylation domain-containing protein [Chloroflexota bacterium]
MTTSALTPMSKNQHGLWLLQTMHPEMVAYNVSSVFRVQSYLNVEALHSAFNEIICRYPMLRTTFTLNDGKPTQCIHPEIVPDFAHVNVADMGEDALKAHVQAMHDRPFDLETGPLTRLAIFSRKEGDHVVLFSWHHILLDFHAQTMITQEILDVYQSITCTRTASLNRLNGSSKPEETHHESTSYTDFVAWQENYANNEKCERSQQHWAEQLQTPLPILDLPTDHPYPAQQTYNGNSLPICLPEALSQGITALAQQAEVTPFVLLMSAYALLMARYSNQDDLIIGVPTDERLTAPKRFQQMVGHMVNLLPMRLSISKEDSFEDILRQAEGIAMGGLFHQSYSFARMVQDAQIERASSHPPLFDVSFNLLTANTNEPIARLIRWVPETPMDPISLGDLQILPYPIRHQEAQVPLHLDMWQQGNQWVGCFKYNADLFDEATIARMASHFTVLLEGIVSQPEQPIPQLPMLTGAEYHQIVHEWNDTAVDFGEAQTIHALFEGQVKRTPNAVALIFENEQLTYHELNERANQLAHHLIELGVYADTLVAVSMERSIEIVVSLLAILKAGGAYVPIDPTYPKERIHYMLADSAAPILLTQSHLPLAPFAGDDGVEGSASQSMHVLAVDKMITALAAQPTANPQTATLRQAQSTASVDDLAYVIYTSGSTGQPKGVAIPHGNLTNLVLDNIQRFAVSESSCVMHAPTFGFDVEVGDLFMALCSGARLYLPSPEKLVGEFLGSQLRQSKATHVSLTPTALSTLPVEPYPHLQHMIVAGEALPDALTQSWLPCTSVWNAYGPTENTIYTTATQCQIDVKVHIGRPTTNVKTFILDDAGSPVPMGIAGELHIGGTQLAREYLNRPELTAERFINHPKFGRLYKTGDLCRWLPDGNIEYIGRTDFQVKLRGFRIELGEIENALLAQEGVREALVLVREENGAGALGARLVAYLVAELKSGKVEGDDTDPSTLQPFNPSTLRQTLAQQLPDYMIPSAFVFLDAMPLSPNGKLDRQALPAPEYTDLQSEFVAPRTEMETAVAGIWQEVLHVEQVGVHDNFFAIGGHSLLAAQVISRVRSQLNLDIPLKSLFDASRLGDFVEIVSQTQESTDKPIVRISREQPLPLSFAQQRLWFLDQLEPDSAFYNIPMLLRLTGQLDVAALDASFHYLIERHESLRTVFGPHSSPPLPSDETFPLPDRGRLGGGDEANQLIHPPSWATQFTLAITPVADEGEAQRLAQIEFTTAFNLSEGPLFRVQLLQIADDDALLVLNMHHIISDGWSMGVLMQELTRAYRAYTMGQQPTLPDLPIQYADFAVWQREVLSGERLEAQLAYWRTQLTRAPVLLELPTDRPRPPMQSYRGANYAFELSADLTTKLNQLAQAHDATLFMVVLAAFNILLARYSRQDDIVVGSPIANRNRAEIEGLIGFFVNSLVLRTQLEDNPSFSELLAQVRQTTLDAYQHQDLPFEQLVEVLDLERSLSHTPLFQVMLDLQKDEIGTLDLSDPSSLATSLSATMQPADFPFAKFDLTLTLVEQSKGGGLSGIFEYAIDLFDATTIARMASHFTVLLEKIVEQPELSVRQLPMLTKAEYRQIVHEWNDTSVDFGEPQTINTLFEEQVERTPDALAVQSPKSRVQSQHGSTQTHESRITNHDYLTYRELNARANQLANHMIELGVQADTLVSVAMERSVEMVVTLLAVLKAGGAYVPIDPTYPEERIRYMLTDSTASILLTQSHLSLAQLIEDWGGEGDTEQPIRVLAVDTMASELEAQSSDNPQTQTSVDDLAYVIYTSGSTGQPKGVMIEHGSLAKHVCTAIEQYQIDSTDTVLQFASMSFDVSLEQIFVALCSGAKLLLRGNQLWTSEAFDHLLIRHEITVADLPPAYCEQLLQHWLVDPSPLLSSSLRLILIGGEKATPDMLRLWQQLPRENIQLLNAYGPTEATITATSFDLDKVQAEAVHIPIGQPLPNRSVYILDVSTQPTAVGIAGELHIGGDGLARGYLNRPELTAECFINHPEFGRLYKTGDLCRWLTDGNIEYIGRTDFQVKIRGFRIELGEIESALLAQEGVNEAVVLAREESIGDKRLVAYLVESGKWKVESDGESSSTLQPFNSSTLRTSLAQKLPDYMIPSAFVFLDAMPSTPNGKLDRGALPAPDYVDLQCEFVAPRTEMETAVADIWQEVLGFDQASPEHSRRVGVYDNFFALGGHSLLATKVISAIRHRLNINIPVKMMFETHSLQEFAKSIELLISHESTKSTISFSALDEEF